MSLFSRIIQRSFDLLQQQDVDLAEAAPETLQIVEAPPQISDLTIATVPTAPVPPDLESTEFTIPDTSLNLSIRGQYRKERRVRGTFVPSIVNGVIQLGSLSAGGEPLQPATQVRLHIGGVEILDLIMLNMNSLLKQVTDFEYW